MARALKLLNRVTTCAMEYTYNLPLAGDIEPPAKGPHSPPPQAAGQPERFSHTIQPPSSPPPSRPHRRGTVPRPAAGSWRCDQWEHRSGRPAYRGQRTGQRATAHAGQSDTAHRSRHSGWCTQTEYGYASQSSPSPIWERSSVAERYNSFTRVVSV